MRSIFQRVRQQLGLLLGSHGIHGNLNTLFAYISTLLSLLIAYRLRFYVEFLKADNKPFGQTTSAFNLHVWSAAFLQDLAMVFIFCLPLMIIFSLVALWARRRKSGKTQTNAKILKLAKIAFAVFIAFLVTGAALLTGSHHQLVFTMNSGLTYEALIEFLQVLSIRNFISVMTYSDIVYLFIPATLFTVFYFFSSFFRRMRNYFFFSVIATYSILILFFFSTQRVQGTPKEIYYNPVVYLLNDIKTAITSQPVKLSLKSVNSVTTGMQLTGELFADRDKSFTSNVYSERKAWNIVFVILESNGSLYIFNKEKYGKGKIPMPFLYELSKKSLFFSNHFTSNNSSPRAIFSMFSGLYESPKAEFFATRKDVHVPHMADFFPEHKTRYLVTPADLDWYFPKWFFKNRKFTELYDYMKLPFVRQKAGPALIGDEINVSNFFREFDVSDFFVKKFQDAQKPFFAVYYSFAGHWPYHDYGEKYRVVPADSSVNRYVNNLYVQDLVIEKIYKGLEQAGLLRNTILIITGDHSEAFYQHSGNRTHSQESYNENIKSPAIIWQPELFSPQEIKEPTSHVDILPTLLDAVRANHNPLLFQGESVLKKSRVRKHVFTYGNENAITAIDKNNVKITIKNKTNECRLFKLTEDPAEKHPARCQNESDIYKSAKLYMRLQPELLEEYNKSHKTGAKDFKGHSHFTNKAQEILNW